MSAEPIRFGLHLNLAIPDAKERTMDELDIYLNEDETTELITEVETVIEAIRTGKMEGEYLEF